MAKLEDLAFRIVADGKQAIREVRRVSGETQKESKETEKRTSRMHGVMAKGSAAAAAGFAAAGLAVKKLGDFVGDSIGLFKEQARQEAQLNSVLESTGHAAGVSAEQVKRMASELQGVTNFGDEATLSAANLLLTFKNIGSDVFPSALEATLDMSQALGQDLKSSSIQLGKALNDPITGVSALQRVGVSFTESQKATIERMVEMGDTAGAQALILAELESQFGGAAAAAREADGGTQALANAWGDFQEQVGKRALAKAVPIVEGLTEGIVGLIDSLDGDSVDQTFVDGLLDELAEAEERMKIIRAGFEDQKSWWERTDWLRFGPDITGGFDEVDNIADALHRLHEEGVGAARLLELLPDIGREFGLSASEAAELRDRVLEFDDLDNATERMDDLRRANQLAAGEMRNAAAGNEELAESSEDAAEALEEEAERVAELKGAIDDLYGAQVDYAGAAEAVRDAEADLDAVLADSESTWRDRRDAVVDVVEARERERELAAQVAGQERTERESVRDTTADYIAYAETLDGPARDAIYQRIADINLIPTEKQTDFKAALAAGDLAQVERMIDDAAEDRDVNIVMRATVDAQRRANARRHLAAPVSVPLQAYVDTVAAQRSFLALERRGRASGGFANAGDVAGENYRPEVVRRGGRAELVTGPTALAGGDQVIGEQQTAAMLARRPTVHQTTIIQHLPPGVTAAQVQSAQRRYRQLEGGDL